MSKAKQSKGSEPLIQATARGFLRFHSDGRQDRRSYVAKDGYGRELGAYTSRDEAERCPGAVVEIEERWIPDGYWCMGQVDGS